MILIAATKAPHIKKGCTKMLWIVDIRWAAFIFIKILLASRLKGKMRITLVRWRDGLIAVGYAMKRR